MVYAASVIMLVRSSGSLIRPIEMVSTIDDTVMMMFALASAI